MLIIIYIFSPFRHIEEEAFPLLILLHVALQHSSRVENPKTVKGRFGRQKWGNEKMLITSSFSFSYFVFYTKCTNLTFESHLDRLLELL